MNFPNPHKAACLFLHKPSNLMCVASSWEQCHYEGQTWDTCPPSRDPLQHTRANNAWAQLQKDMPNCTMTRARGMCIATVQTNHKQCTGGTTLTRPCTWSNTAFNAISEKMFVPTPEYCLDELPNKHIDGRLDIPNLFRQTPNKINVCLDKAVANMGIGWIQDKCAKLGESKHPRFLQIQQPPLY